MSRITFRSLTLVAVLAFAAYPALAQDIQGVVRYAEGNDPVFNVPVQCRGFGCTGYTYTDRNGKFRFRFDVTGNYTISVEVPGYKPEVREVALVDKQSSEYIFFKLRRDPNATGEAAPPAKPAVIDPKVPAPARKEYEDGLKEVEAGQASKAIPHLEKAISLYPDFLQAHLMLGSAYMDDKQWDKAETALRRAVELDPKRSEGLFALGELYYQQKKYSEAEKPLVLGLQLQDNSWQGHYTLARVYMDAKAFDKAAPHMEKANKLRPEFAEGHFLAANIYLKTNNGEGALKEFEEYLRLAPKGKFAPQVQTTVTKLKEILKK